MPKIYENTNIRIDATCAPHLVIFEIYTVPGDYFIDPSPASADGWGSKNITRVACKEASKLFSMMFHLRAPVGNPDYRKTGSFSQAHSEVSKPKEVVTETLSYKEVPQPAGDPTYKFTYKSKFVDKNTIPPTPISNTSCSLTFTRSDAKKLARAIESALKACCRGVKLL